MSTARQRRERDEAVVALYMSGKTLEATGKEYGICRERVRQLVAEVVPDRAARRATRRADREAARLLIQRQREANSPWLTCFTCHGRFQTTNGSKLRAKKPFCTRVCCDLFRKTRHLIDRESWLKAVAKCAIKANKKSALRWAARTLAGLPSSRTSYHKPSPTSLCGKAYAEVLRLREQNRMEVSA